MMSQADSASALSTLVPTAQSTSPQTPISRTQHFPQQAARASPSAVSDANSTKQMSKLLLRNALQKANSAVLCDSSNDTVGAIAAYSEAIELLDRVLVTVDKENDRKRLQEIHDSYSDRIRLLKALLPKPDPGKRPERSDNDGSHTVEATKETSTPDDKKKPTSDSQSVASANEQQDEEDARSWLSKPAKRNFTGQRGGKSAQPVYGPFLNRMGSSSSLESSISPLESKHTGPPYRQEPSISSWSPSQLAHRSPYSYANSNGAMFSGSMQTFSRSGSTTSLHSPSPMPSKSSPTDLRAGVGSRAAKRRSQQSAIEGEGSDPPHIHPTEPVPTARRPSTASVATTVHEPAEQPAARLSNYPQGAVLPRQSSRAAAVFLQAAKNTASRQPPQGNPTATTTNTAQIVTSSALLKRTSSTSTTSSTTSLDSFSESDSSPTTAQSPNSNNSNMGYAQAIVLPIQHTKPQTTMANAHAERAQSPSGQLTSALNLASSSQSTARANQFDLSRPLPPAPSLASFSTPTGQAPVRTQTATVVKVPQWHSGDVAPAMRRTLTQPAKKQDASDIMASQHRRPSAVLQSTGFASVRKFSNQRSSSMNIDGAPAMRRAQSGHNAAPGYGMLMKDVMASKTVEEGGSANYNSAPTQGTIHLVPNLDTHNRFAAMASDRKSINALASDIPLKVIIALQQSMEHGAHVTPRLYIPKDMWLQPNIRLPSIEHKLAACESLTADLSRLEIWITLNDFVGSLRLLESLEEAVENLQANLLKKLKRESMDNAHTNQSTHVANTRDPNGSPDGPIVTKKTQSFMSWGSKLTKSVERMNAFSLTKAEDQYRAYIEALQRLFVKTQVLAKWWHHYTETKKRDTDNLNVGCDAVLQKLTQVCQLLDVVVGGLIIRDMAIILGKWLKRSTTWVNE